MRNPKTYAPRKIKIKIRKGGTLMNIRDILRPSLREQAARTERKPQKSTSASASFVPKRSTDRLTLSKAALSFVQEQNRLAWEERPEKKESSPLKALEKEQSTQDKLMKIAARLRKGDHVPPEDEAYLMKHDPAFYMLTMSQRKENPHPKKWETLLSDEDRQELNEVGTDSPAAQMSLPTVPGGNA